MYPYIQVICIDKRYIAGGVDHTPTHQHVEDEFSNMHVIDLFVSIKYNIQLRS
jgi:hypothetical protein